MSKSIVINEHSSLKLDECYLKKLKAYLKRNNLNSALHVTDFGVKSTSWVGIIKYKNIQFQILPKLIYTKEYEDADEQSEKRIERDILNNLIFMLSYTKKLAIKTCDDAKLSTSKNPFIEILIREFSTSLFNCLKRLTPLQYIREENNIKTLKGKLNFTQNIKYNSADKTKFYCEYDDFSENNILNQLFLYVSICLYNISEDRKNKKILNLIINYYCDIEPVMISKSQVEKIKLTKNQALFKKPFMLAKMFIEKANVNLSDNKFESIALVWDMNKLFEGFIYELMRECKAEWECELLPQKGRRLLKNDYCKKRNTYVDIMITKSQPREKIVLDTKYKELSDENDFINSDVFQVSTYCLIHNATHSILLYPQWDKKISAKYELNTLDEAITKNYVIELETVNLRYRNIKNELGKIKEELRGILKIPEKV